MDLIKRLLKIVIPAAIAIIVVNDTGRYLQAQYELGKITLDAAVVSADAYKKVGDRTASWRAGQSLAEKYGADVYGFDVENERVHVWTRMPVAGTFAAQRVIALIDRKTADTPLTVEADELALIQ